MTAQNRYLSGDINSVLAPVKGATVIETGDLLFLNNAGGLLNSTSTVDNYVYPISDLKPASGGLQTANSLYTTFYGVAMGSSKSGVTEKITVAVSGLFRYPLHPTYQTSAVTLGALISAVSNEIAAGVSKDYVILTTTNPGSTAYLGYCQKTESAATFVDFEIMTAFGPFGVAS